MLRGWLFLASVTVLFLGPLAALFAEARPEHWREVLESASFPNAAWATLLAGAGGALLSVVIGLAWARPFATWRWRGKRFDRLLGLLPYLLPNFVLASAYVVAWNPTTGLLLELVPLPTDLYGGFGLTVLFAVAHAPLALLMLEGKLLRLDASLTEAARMAGADSGRVFVRIELPLLRPTLVSAFALAFALNVSAFAIPAWIGAPDRVYTLTYKIYQAIQVGGAEGLPLAAVYSVALFALAAPLLVALAVAQRNEKRYAVVSGKAARTADRVPPRGRVLAFRAVYLAYQLGTFVLPIGALLLTTVTRPGCLQHRGAACLQDLTLYSYRYVLFELSETRLAFFGSGVYGTLSAVVIMTLAVAALIALARTPRALAVTESLFALLMTTPGAIIALGLIVSASGRFGINLYNTPWIVVAAMVLKHTSLAFQPLRTGLANLSPSLAEAARIAGADTRRVWTRVIVPILRPDVTGAFFLVLIPILGELTMSVFLASPSYRSIGTVLFDLQDYADQASAASLSVILMVIVLITNEVARRLTRGRFGF